MRTEPVAGAIRLVSGPIRTIGLGAALLALAVPGCSRAPDPNILVIVVDALRADRLGCYGYERGLTPFLDSLAAKGTVFERAYAAATWTSPSIASLRTSRYVSQHGIRSFQSVLAESEVTLTEALAGHGYVTAGFTANGLINRHLGFAQGYQKYEAILERRDPARPNAPLAIPLRAPAINRLALEWLDGPTPGGAPVFLYVHYMETHPPYDPPEPILERIFDGRQTPDLDQLNASLLRMTGGLAPVDQDVLRDARDVYDAEVAAVDAGIRDLFAGLERRGFLRHAVVVITADHGEGLGEHGLVGHRSALYGEVIRVPLILLVPGGSQRSEVREPVSLVDVAPTLLDLAGRTPPASFEGRSLVPLVSGRGDEGSSGRAVFSERKTRHQVAVIRGSAKMIAVGDGQREFYDLAADPQETHPDALGAGDRAALEASLAQFRAHAEATASVHRTQAIDEGTREGLRRLGYAE